MSCVGARDCSEWPDEKKPEAKPKAERPDERNLVDQNGPEVFTRELTTIEVLREVKTEVRGPIPRETEQAIFDNCEYLLMPLRQQVARLESEVAQIKLWQNDHEIAAEEEFDRKLSTRGAKATLAALGSHAPVGAKPSQVLLTEDDMVEIGRRAKLEITTVEMVEARLQLAEELGLSRYEGIQKELAEQKVMLDKIWKREMRDDKILTSCLQEMRDEVGSELKREMTEEINKMRTELFHKLPAVEAGSELDADGQQWTPRDSSQELDKIRSADDAHVDDSGSNGSFTDPADAADSAVACSAAGEMRVNWNLLESEGQRTKTLRKSQTGLAVNDVKDLTNGRWEFSQSCWDAAAFVGNSELLLPMEAIYITWLVVLNAMMQLCFIAITFYAFLKSPVDEETIEGFHLWRTNVGHNVQFMNPLTLESLASRVCRGDASLHLSDTQAQVVDDIDEYLYNHAPFNGPMMALLAIFTWILTVVTEFHHVQDMAGALLSVPRGQTSVSLIMEGSESRLKLVSIAKGRLFFIAALTIIRLGIAATLLFAGIVYLAYTISLEDILLNSVALEFVLGIDELLYASLAPAKTRRLIALLNELPLRKHRHWQGLDFDVAAISLATWGLLGVAVGVYMVPSILHMIDARRELCSGFMEFSYALTAVGNVAWGTDNSSTEESIERLFASSRYQVIQNVIKSGQDQNVWSKDRMLSAHYASTLHGPGWSVQNLAKAPVEYFASQLNRGCEDLLILKGDEEDQSHFTLKPMALAAVRDLSGNQSVSLCTELVAYCNDFESPGPTVRMLCPTTCGCNNPASALAVAEAADGCPKECKTHWISKLVEQVRDCTDTPKHMLLNDSIWKKHAKNLRTATSKFPRENRILASNAADMMLKYGCQVQSHLNKTSMSLCGPHPTLRTIAFWCPATCLCNSTYDAKSVFCPQACATPTHMDKALKVGTQSPTEVNDEIDNYAWSD